MHDFARDESVRLDVAQGVAEPTGAGASFLYASGDGSVVLFTDPQQLTKAAGGGTYECRVVETAARPSCELELTGLSVGGQSLVDGSEDASYLYFEGAGERLHVDHYNGREWTTTEGPVVNFESPGESGPLYRVSPNGLWLAFTSNRDLTGYDTDDAVTGRPDIEVYLYSASANKLVCASCNPTGARPVGAEYSEHDFYYGALFAGAHLWFNHGAGVAANVPAWTQSSATTTPYYQPRYLSDSGRLFFNSSDALVSQDVNGTEDVYEYEPPGVGSCTPAVETFSERSGGCVDLVSSGTSPEESAFLDASATGGDVFFMTASKLVSQDFDDALDVYDARECSTETSCFPVVPVAPPPCSSGDSCKAAPSPQPAVFGMPSSETFSGAGNIVASSPGPAVAPKASTRVQRLAAALRVCRRKPKKRRLGCEKAARRAYGSTPGARESRKGGE
jgi:hypothetical protein